MLLQFLLIFIPFLFDVYYNLQLERPSFPTRKTEVSSKLIWSSYTQFKSLWRELNACSNMWCFFQPCDMHSLNKQKIFFCILMLFDKQSSAVYYKDMKSSNLEQIKIILIPAVSDSYVPESTAGMSITSKHTCLVCLTDWLISFQHCTLTALDNTAVISRLWPTGICF